MGDEFSLAELARAVWRRKGLVALIIIASILVSGVITRLLPKIFRAETSVFFPEPREAFLSAAVGAFGQSLPAALAGLGRGTGASALCKAIAESYSVRAEIVREYDLQDRFEADSFQDATAKLLSATWVTITRDGLLSIRVDATDSQLAADLANAYARIVERRYRDSSVSRAHREREFLEGRVAEAHADLARAEADLKAYQERDDALLVPEEVPPILQKLADIRIEQATAQVDLEALRQRRDEAITQLDRLAADSVDAAERPVYAVPWERSSETMADNPDIAELRARLVALEVELAAARHRLSAEHPEYKQLQTQVEETRARLAGEARRTITAETRSRNPVYAGALEQLVTLEVAAIGQEARAQGLGQLVRQIEATADTLPDRLLRYARLEREVGARETIYTMLTAQLEAAKLKELQEQPVFEVLDVAVAPERHHRPKLLVNLVVALLVGAFVAVAVAAALGPPRSEPAN